MGPGPLKCVNVMLSDTLKILKPPFGVSTTCARLQLDKHCKMRGV